MVITQPAEEPPSDDSRRNIFFVKSLIIFFPCSWLFSPTVPTYLKYKQSFLGILGSYVAQTVVNFTSMIFTIVVEAHMIHV